MLSCLLVLSTFGWIVPPKYGEVALTSLTEKAFTGIVTGLTPFESRRILRIFCGKNAEEGNFVFL